MKRLLIFAVLGPPIGMVMFLHGLLWITGGGQAPPIDYHEVVLLPLAYYVGIVPAVIVAAFDGFLARRNIGWRPLWCALFASATSFIPLLSSLYMGFLHGLFWLGWGLLGAVPGAICSWIAGKFDRRPDHELDLSRGTPAPDA